MGERLTKYLRFLSLLFSVISGGYFAYLLVTQYMTIASFLLLLMFVISCAVFIWVIYKEFRQDYINRIGELRSYVDLMNSGLNQRIETQSKNLQDHLVAHDKKQLSE